MNRYVNGACGGDLAGGSGQSGRVPIRQSDRRARLRERHSQSKAKVTGAARHECGSPLKAQQTKNVTIDQGQMQRGGIISSDHCSRVGRQRPSPERYQ